MTTTDTNWVIEFVADDGHVRACHDSDSEESAMTALPKWESWSKSADWTGRFQVTKVTTMITRERIYPKEEP